MIDKENTMPFAASDPFNASVPRLTPSSVRTSSSVFHEEQLPPRAYTPDAAVRPNVRNSDQIEISEEGIVRNVSFTNVEANVSVFGGGKLIDVYDNNGMCPFF